jgi:uncharacterized protein
VWMTAALPELAAAGGGSTAMVPDNAVADTIARYQAGGLSAVKANAISWAFLQGMSLFMYVFATVPLMMLGMGLFKAGFFTGRSPLWVYLALIAGGGATLALLGVLSWREAMAGPGVEATGGAAAAVASFPLIIALGYASLIILATRRGLGLIGRIFAPVGRMAFTNYLAQTLIMSTIFYMPWGPRLYGQVDFAALWPIVGAVWVATLIWSSLWLSRFRMGPLEWLWRTLTYGRRLPLLKAG